MNLRELQQQMLASIINAEPSVCDFLVPDKQAQRLAIYRHNTLGARFSSLQQIFPCAEKLLGADYFQQLLEQFLQQTPSTHWQIEASATDFMRFVAQHEVLNYVPYLVDMLQFEQAWYRVFHANRVKISTFAEIGSLQLAENVQLVCSDYPLAEIWSMCQPEYAGDFELKDTDDKSYLALVPRGQVEIVILNQLTWQILQHLQKQPSVRNLQKKFSITATEIKTTLIETGLVQYFTP